MKIVTGKTVKPLKVLVYGVEGIGKSTLASRFKNPVFFDFENGTAYLDVARVEMANASTGEIIGAINELSNEPQGFRTLVFDTSDWMDACITQSMLKASGMASLSDYGYGKGFEMLRLEWAKVMRAVDNLQRKTAIDVVFLAHAVQRKVEVVGEGNSYDHWELKTQKSVAPVLKEWADFVFFLRYDVYTVTDKGKAIAKGGDRVIMTRHSTGWDAKSRVELPEKIEMTPDGIAKLVAKIQPEIADSPSFEPVVEAKPEKTGKRVNLEALKAMVDIDGVNVEDVLAVARTKGIIGTGDGFGDIPEEGAKRLADAWEKVKRIIEKTNR